MVLGDLSLEDDEIRFPLRYRFGNMLTRSGDDDADRNASLKVFAGAVATALAMCICTGSQGQAARGPVDPGCAAARRVPHSAGRLTADETAFFQNGLAKFLDIESVTGGENEGLGPRFNSNQVPVCHSQPSVADPALRPTPLIAIATLDGARNVVPWFITRNGPIREARFKRNPNGTNDGGVHNLFVITGRKDAAGCNIAQPRFLPAGTRSPEKGGNPNIIFRIPTPVFGAGPHRGDPRLGDSRKHEGPGAPEEALGILGHPNAHLSGNANRNGNDGTITRFGWKAQNKSLLLFSGEAYNVEMGVTSQLFPQERDETPGCVFNATPEDTVNFTPTSRTTSKRIRPLSRTSRRLPTSCGCWAPPTPAPETPSTANDGRFRKVGCAFCHTPSLTTGKAIASGSSTSRAPHCPTAR